MIWLGLLLAAVFSQLLRLGYALLVCRQLDLRVRELIIGTLPLVEVGRVRGVMVTLGALPLGGGPQLARPLSSLPIWPGLQIRLLPDLLVFATLWAVFGLQPFAFALIEVAAHAHAFLRPWSVEHAQLSVDFAANMATAPVQGVLHAMIAVFMLSLLLRLFDALFGMPRVDAVMQGCVAGYFHLCAVLLCL